MLRPAVILANHHNRQLGGEAVNVAVIEAPQNVLGPVAADSEFKALRGT